MTCVSCLLSRLYLQTMSRRQYDVRSDERPATNMLIVDIPQCNIVRIPVVVGRSPTNNPRLCGDVVFVNTVAAVVVVVVGTH